MSVPRKTMVWRRMGRLVVTVHTEDVPNEEDWNGYIAQVHDYQPLEAQRVLVISAGGGPNGTQRKMMVDALAGAKTPVAILTNSLMMRSAGIAVSWFNPSLKVFGPTALDPAMDYLELTPWERAESKRCVVDLQNKVGIAVARADKVANG